ncbi:MULTISPECIES: permease-like cell division protein FtsX [Ruminococcus]|uniref:Cell division protein FtsX n=1 Tax=Ruminococcus difficilis TaxID=2763069 RepID=A0A934WU93_9FIRM|nr:MULTISPECIES: permease-like cell division protein FtsX [Ruminococcus]MBK6090079.1 ABC transporter permease [Ruminococcus difficilis]MEE3492735.1 permease-like cell division protein FtsX [Ruminococcus sp.]
MSSFGYLIKEGFKNLVHNRLMTLASIGVLISCLVLTGSAVMLTINVSNIVDSVGDTNVTKVFLDDSYTKLEAVYKGKELSQVANVSQVEFIDKDEAIQAYRDQLGDEVFANMSGDDNPLPYAYSVKMDDLSKYDDTVARIKEVEGVASVSSHREVAEKLTNLSSFITTMSLWIILALAIISLFIISNTIRMTMFSHRFEISIMKSVGATNAFVRVPFIIEGIVIGLISAIIAIGLLFVLSDAIINSVQKILDFKYTRFTEVMWPIIGSFVAAGVLVGSLGSMVSIRRFLTHEGNEVLGW